MGKQVNTRSQSGNYLEYYKIQYIYYHRKKFIYIKYIIRL